MKVAFLNLCHTDPQLVARAACRLTADPDFQMLIHLDAKADAEPFAQALKGLPRTEMIPERVKVYWGGFSAVQATVALLRAALAAPQRYSYLVLLQNLDYPIRSNAYIKQFFAERQGTEFIRACRIAGTRDFKELGNKYRLWYGRDGDFALPAASLPAKAARYLRQAVMSLTTLPWDGIIHEKGESFPLHYGAAQWAVTRELAEYFVRFYDTHPHFNAKMAHVRFPDEEYFHTIAHNSPFKQRCSSFNEPERRWLVNWRNLHYFEYPDRITVFTAADHARIAAQAQDALFLRKVTSQDSAALLDLLDAECDTGPTAP